jgi:hypothetical protein
VIGVQCSVFSAVYCWENLLKSGFLIDGYCYLDSIGGVFVAGHRKKGRVIQKSLLMKTPGGLKFGFGIG